MVDLFKPIFPCVGWGGVIGGPGTGKGTQCTRLKDEFGFKHISLGDILRNEVKQGSTIGKQCENLMKDGKLVPLPLTMQLMKKALQTSGHHSGYLIDGFPRAVEQAKAFQQQVRILTFWHFCTQIMYTYVCEPQIYIAWSLHVNPCTVMSLHCLVRQNLR